MTFAYVRMFACVYVDQYVYIMWCAGVHAHNSVYVAMRGLY